MELPLTAMDESSTSVQAHTDTLNAISDNSVSHTDGPQTFVAQDSIQNA